MRNLLTLLKWNLRREKLSVVITLALSALILFAGASIMNLAEDYVMVTNIALTDKDNSNASKDLSRYLEEELGVVVKTGLDDKQIKRELVERDLSAAILIPKGYEDNLLTQKTDPLNITVLGDYENAAFLQGYLESYVSSLTTLAVTADGDEVVFADLLSKTTDEKIEITILEKDKEKQRKESQMAGFQSAVGFFIMFASVCMIALSSMLFTDRKNGTFRRLQSGDVSAFQYTLAFLFIGLINLTLMLLPLLIACKAFDIYTGVPFGIIVILLSALILFIASFGVLIGIVSPSMNAIIAIIIVSSTITSLVGGAWFPIDTAPEIFRILGKATPQYWILNTFQSYAKGDGNSLLLPLGILFLYTLLFLALSARKFSSKRLRS
ncbi:MAG: ABC transporter permease [Clostridiales Family XIII bacterium]|jgi:ABC-2 type transport system permease protein|nr:ABC transporter permease [Clostridiales Family XIII bacterium]